MKEEFIRKIEQIGLKVGIYRSFDDFCKLSAAAISANCGNKEMEQRYLDIVKTYDNKEIKIFTELLGELTKIIKNEPYSDVLGELYMSLKINQGKLGQFFTPQHISDLTASLSYNVQNIQEEINEKGGIEVAEPCSGGASLVLGFAKYVKKIGFDPGKVINFYCNDLDSMCVNMTYIQMSLNGLKAEVTRGDGLANEIFETHITPRKYFLGGG